MCHRLIAILNINCFCCRSDQLFIRPHPEKSDVIGSWGDSDSLLTRDRLRESYGLGGTLSASTANTRRMVSGIPADAYAQNKKSDFLGSHSFG